MASRNPHADWDLLGAQTEPLMSAHDFVCLHAMAGFLAGTRAMFKDGGFSGTESHYGVGGQFDGEDDGKAYQWQDRAHQADANLDGNPEVISIETSDGNRDAPMSLAQIDKIVDIVAWECSLEAHEDCPPGWACRQGVDWRGIRVAIPPELVPDTKPGRRGLAVHRQGITHSSSYVAAGWPYDSWLNERPGTRWSEVISKVCPRDVRIRQWVDIIIPKVQARLLGEGNDVELSTVVNKETGLTYGQLLRQLDRYIDNSATREVELADKVAATRSAVLEAVEAVRLVAVEARQRATEARARADAAVTAAQAATAAADAAATLAEVESALERMQVVFQVVVPPAETTTSAQAWASNN